MSSVPKDILKDVRCPNRSCRLRGCIEFVDKGFHCSNCGMAVSIEELLPQISVLETLQYLPDLPEKDPIALRDYEPVNLDPSIMGTGLGYGFGQQVHLSNEERTNLYMTTTIPVFITFAVLYVVISRFFPISDNPWLWWIGIFFVSRLADILSTFIGLSLGATELNPVSDPHDITGMLPLQIVQIGVMIGISFLLGLIGPWWKIGFLFAISLTGFEACFANLGQVFSGPTMVAYGTDPSEATASKLYSAHVGAVIWVGLIASAILWFAFR